MASAGLSTLGNYILAKLRGSLVEVGAPDPKDSSTMDTQLGRTYTDSLLAWYATTLHYSKYSSASNLVFTHETALQQLVSLSPITSTITEVQADQAEKPQQLNSPTSLIIELTDMLANAPAGKTQDDIRLTHVRTECDSSSTSFTEDPDQCQQQHKDFSSKSGTASDIVLALRCMLLTAKLFTLMIDHQGTTMCSKSELSVPYIWQQHLLKTALVHFKRHIGDQRSALHAHQSLDDVETLQCHQLAAATVRLMLTSIRGSLKHNVEAINDCCLVLAPLLYSHWEPSAAARSEILNSGKHDS